jgi:ABC-type ATPase involved in cell division
MKTRDIINIKTLLKDATEQIGIDHYSVDVCLMATVLHDFEEIHKAGNTIIVVTHEEDIARHAHRIIRLIDGNVSSDEKNKNIRTMSYYKDIPKSED